MTDHETSRENISFLGGADPDLLVIEKRIERVLAAPIDRDATWSLVRSRVGLEPGVVPLRSRRRRRGLPLVAIAAALLVSGVAFAAAGPGGGSSGTHARPGFVGRPIPGATQRPDANGGSPSATHASGRSDVGPSATPVAVPPPATSTGSPGSGPSAGSTQQPGDDQPGGQGQDEQSPDPSGDQQDQSGTGDGGDGQSDPATDTTGSDQGTTFASSTDGDQ